MSKPSFRDLFGKIGIFETGPLNSITDVFGVSVSHVTIKDNDGINTGLTAIKPHAGNIFFSRVPAGVFIANGYGKLTGSTQLTELGEIETPIILTNTLSVPAAMQGLLNYTLAENQTSDIRSINPIVGETNDGFLNNISKMVVKPEHVLEALCNCSTKKVEEGCVGAGTGTICLGWKGGIGSSSRIVRIGGADHTIGVLVQSNFSGRLRLNGKEFDNLPNDKPLYKDDSEKDDGSIMIIIATDAPLSDRNLKRLAMRSIAGVARVGSDLSNGSGDYAIAFSTHTDCRREMKSRSPIRINHELINEEISPLFQATIDATEESILNSLFFAVSTIGYKGTIENLPIVDLERIYNSRK